MVRKNAGEPIPLNQSMIAESSLPTLWHSICEFPLILCHFAQLNFCLLLSHSLARGYNGIFGRFIWITTILWWSFSFPLSKRFSIQISFISIFYSWLLLILWSIIFVVCANHRRSRRDTIKTKSPMRLDKSALARVTQKEREREEKQWKSQVCVVLYVCNVSSAAQE